MRYADILDLGGGGSLIVLLATLATLVYVWIRWRDSRPARPVTSTPAAVS
jgi:hypothetical protein